MCVALAVGVCGVVGMSVSLAVGVCGVVGVCSTSSWCVWSCRCV